MAAKNKKGKKRLYPHHHEHPHHVHYVMMTVLMMAVFAAFIIVLYLTGMQSPLHMIQYPAHTIASSSLSHLNYTNASNPNAH